MWCVHCIPADIQAQHHWHRASKGHDHSARWLQIKTILIAVKNSFPDATCYLFTDTWAIVYSLSLQPITWKTSEWQIKCTLLRDDKVWKHHSSWLNTRETNCHSFSFDIHGNISTIKDRAQGKGFHISGKGYHCMLDLWHLAMQLLIVREIK